MHRLKVTERQATLILALARTSLAKLPVKIRPQVPLGVHRYLLQVDPLTAVLIPPPARTSSRLPGKLRPQVFLGVHRSLLQVDPLTAVLIPPPARTSSRLPGKLRPQVLPGVHCPLLRAVPMPAALACSRPVIRTQDWFQLRRQSTGTFRARRALRLTRLRAPRWGNRNPTQPGRIHPPTKVRPRQPRPALAVSQRSRPTTQAL
ncbi:MAG TPA: hypothetical protein VKM93_01835 [Terriglobia bacterium]|nr:hypothetical protein [Terriglobia bacterium]